VKTETSVIICAYNYARFLPRCLRSVLSQSQPASEIIVVDDGSTDGTAEIVKRFPKVRYIRHDNAGKAASFNRGFRESQGDVICHLDADDYWLPGKLARISETLARHNVGGILHDAVYVDGEDNYLYGSKPAEGVSTVRNLSFQDALLMSFIYRPLNAVSGSLGVANTICVRREAVSDFLPLPAELGLAVDGALIFGAARRGLVHLSEKLSAYRHHGKNCFVSTPGSTEFQSRLFKWIPTLPGVTAPRDRRLLQALWLETRIHLAVHAGKDAFENACAATLLPPTLIRLGLVPHWKHFGLPVASLFGWPRVRRMLERSVAVNATWARSN
jgi:glycosyltransferase involved in cell wall biosynthesis